VTTSPVEADALVVGMSLVPALLSRNRSFSLFEDPVVRRARHRAGLLRGIVRQLAGAHGEVDSLLIARSTGGCELSYRLPGMKMQRRACLTDLELACVRYLAGRAGARGIRVTEEERAAIDTALRRLAAGLRLPEVDAGLNG
jgi:hypothetical protein